MQKQNLKILVECAVMIALASVFSNIKIYTAPLGGSVTLFSMVPIIIIALRYGPKWGLTTAFIYSLTQLIFDIGKFSSWGLTTQTSFIGCILFDYIVAFSVLGFAGFFKTAAENSDKRTFKIFIVSSAVTFVCIMRYLSHTIFGALVWFELSKGWAAPDAWINTVGAWTYSAVYNAQYMLPETIINIIAVPAVITVLSVLKNKNFINKENL